ncbi:MAG: hypothetical protein E7633_05825 [Ruminococcaceae bacterium]|nr:hypothetical protein [Oscillospiraceae bacterium]
MKRILAFLLSVILCVSLFACSGTANDIPQDDENNANNENNENNENEEDKKVIEDRKYELKDVTDSLKFLGRNTVTTNGIICDHSASGIEFCAYVEGDVKLSVSVSARVTPSGAYESNTYYTVYIDGVRQEKRFNVASGEATLTIASFAEGGVHTIRILKQTESQNSLSVLKKLQFKGYFEAAPAAKDLLIEFIGDSITSGYGNLCKNGAANPGNALNQDATQTYAFMTAEKLGADHSLVSYSGIGVAKGWPDFLMEEFFTADSYCRSTSTAYEKSFTPDIVVINLGTNDNTKGATATTFMTKAKALINLVRDTYGKDVKIVWVANMMGSSMQTYALKAINALGGEDNGLYMCMLPQEQTGGGGHPSIAGHTAAAEVLANFIQEKILSE